MISSSFTESMTSVPTVPRSSSSSRASTSSSCWPCSTSMAGPAASKRVADRLLLIDQRRAEAIERVHGADDVAALRIQRADERVQLFQRAADVVRAAVHHRVQLLGDGLQLTQPAAAEQEGQGPEDFLDLGVAAGLAERDDVALAESARAARRAFTVLRGSDSAMNFSPSRLVCRISASALSGSMTFLSTRRVARACHPSRTISSTWPTGTLPTITAVRGTTWSASPKSALISKLSSSLTVLPGSGRSWIENEQPLTTKAATNHSGELPDPEASTSLQGPLDDRGEHVGDRFSVPARSPTADTSSERSAARWACRPLSPASSLRTRDRRTRRPPRRTWPAATA